jgi:chemotaxis signal transduction protein
MRHGERLIPLLHLGAVLGLAERPRAPCETTVIVQCGGRVMALGVEQAEEVARREPAPLPDGLDLTWAGAVVREGDRVIPIVDLEAVTERLARVGAES